MIAKTALIVSYLISTLLLSGCSNRLTITSPQHSAESEAIFGTNSTFPKPSIAAKECPIGDYKAAMLTMINSIRAASQSCGEAVGALLWNDQLEFAAETHSTDMAINNYLSHADVNGLRVGHRVKNSGYSYGYTGENIAAGQMNVNDVFNLPDGQGWMSSRTHCKNIMYASHQKVGASCKYNPDTTSQYYWTLVLAD